MRKASVDVKTNQGTYKVYRVEFKDDKHHHNWCKGHNIIRVRFDDGYPGIDGFKQKQ